MLEVLQGKESIKVSIAIDLKTVVILTIGIFIAVLGGVIIARNIS